jgi:hypothetical protein
MKIMVEGYGDMTADVAAELALMRLAERNRVIQQAAANQRRIAAHAGSATARTMQHGHQVAQIDADVFNYWEQREGRGFWADKSNRRAMLKRHPELAVHAKSGRTTITVPELPGSAAPAGTILAASGRPLQPAAA